VIQLLHLRPLINSIYVSLFSVVLEQERRERKYVI